MGKNDICENKKGFVNNPLYFDVIKYFHTNKKQFYQYEDIKDRIKIDSWKDNLKPLLNGKKEIKYKKISIETEPIIKDLSFQIKKELGLYHKIHHFTFNKENLYNLIYKLFVYYLGWLSKNSSKIITKRIKKKLTEIEKYKRKIKTTKTYDAGTFTSIFAEKDIKLLTVEILKEMHNFYSITKQEDYTFPDEIDKKKILKDTEETKKFKKEIRRFFDYFQSESEIEPKGVIKYNKLTYEAFLVTIEKLNWNNFNTLIELFDKIIEKWSYEYTCLTNKTKIPITNKLGNKMPFLFKQCKLIYDIIGEKDKK